MFWKETFCCAGSKRQTGVTISRYALDKQDVSYPVAVMFIFGLLFENKHLHKGFQLKFMKSLISSKSNLLFIVCVLSAKTTYYKEIHFFSRR